MFEVARRLLPPCAVFMPSNKLNYALSEMEEHGGHLTDTGAAHLEDCLHLATRGETLICLIFSFSGDNKKKLKDTGDEVGHWGLVVLERQRKTLARQDPELTGSVPGGCAKRAYLAGGCAACNPWLFEK